MEGTHRSKCFRKRCSLRAMPFLRFVDHLAKTREVFQRGHRKYQSVVLYAPLIYPVHERCTQGRDKDVRSFLPLASSQCGSYWYPVDTLIRID